MEFIKLITSPLSLCEAFSFILQENCTPRPQSGLNNQPDARVMNRVTCPGLAQPCATGIGGEGNRTPVLVAFRANIYMFIRC